ncbi:MAG: hypothetical protein V3T70_10235 [Phycisphaerae bacterium]
MSSPSSEGRPAITSYASADYVAVMFATNHGEAEVCRSVLDEHGIPARIEPDAADRRTPGISVLVPSDYLVDASGLLTDNETTAAYLDGKRNELKAGPPGDDDELDAGDGDDADDNDLDDDEDEFDDDDESDDDRPDTNDDEP